MADSLQTRPSLLLRIRDAGDGDAWSQFAALYAPLVYGFARKRGLQDQDAADLTQEVLSTVSRAVSRFNYDVARGSFRSWLFTIVQRKLLNFVAARARHAQGTGDTGMLEHLHQQAAPEENVQDLWDREYERQLFAWASAEVRTHVEERTWQAFVRTAVDGEKATVVAGMLGLTVAAVRLAKSRVMARIKKAIAEMQLE